MAFLAQELDGFLVQTVAPEIWPVTVAQVKRALDLGDSDDDNDEINDLVPAAVDLVERDSRRALLTQTWVQRFDGFLDEMELRRCPIASVTHVKYYDSSEVLQTLATTVYDTDLTTEPGRVKLGDGQSWPTTATVPNAVAITFVAGWTSAELVPRTAWLAVMLAMRHLFNGCELGDEYWNLVRRLRWSGPA